MGRFLAIPLLILLAATITFAADDVDSRRQIHQAVQRLDDDNWQVREQAQRTLEAADPSARPMLLAILRSTDDHEVRTRLEAVVARMDEHLKVSPTPVTLRLSNVTRREALGALSKQAGIPIELRHLDDRQDEPRFSVNLAGASFWAAVHELCRQTGLQPDVLSQPQRLAFDDCPTRWSQRPVCSSGAFFFVANRIERNYAVDLSRPDDVRHKFTLHLRAYSDPRLLILNNAREVHLTEATDETGQSLLPATSPDYGPEPSEYRSHWEWDLLAKLRHPGQAGRRIARLSGVARFLVRTRHETWTIDDVLGARQVTRIFGANRITIESLTRTDSGFVLRVSGHGNVGGLAGPSVPDQFDGIQRSMKLLDADGRPFAIEFFGGGGSENWFYNFTIARPKGDEARKAPPHRLVWNVPTEAKLMNAPFEFLDLPLP